MAVIIAISELVNIMLQVFWRNGVIRPVDATFQVAPKSFNSIRIEINPTGYIAYKYVWRKGKYE